MTPDQEKRLVKSLEDIAFWMSIIGMVLFFLMVGTCSMRH